MMKITNNLKLPQPLVDAVKNPSYDKQENAISATQLIAPARQYILQQRHEDELTEDASDRLWALMGTNFHHILERAGTKGLTEQRYTVDVNGFNVTGQADLLEGKTLYDYKFTTRYSVAGETKSDWIQQLNIYRWLFEQNGHTVNSLYVIAVLRDWSKMQAKVQKDYPKHQVVKVEIPVWPLRETEDFIRDRLNIIAMCKDAPDDALPECTDEERWTRGGKVAVMEKGKKRAVRLLDNEVEAKAYMDGLNTNKQYFLEHRPKEYIRCMEYCNVNEFCSQWTLCNDPTKEW